jgi:hypothetical protein
MLFKKIYIATSILLFVSFFSLRFYACSISKGTYGFIGLVGPYLLAIAIAAIGLVLAVIGVGLIIQARRSRRSIVYLVLATIFSVLPACIVWVALFALKINLCFSTY